MEPFQILGKYKFNRDNIVSRHPQCCMVHRPLFKSKYSGADWEYRNPFFGRSIINSVASGWHQDMGSIHESCVILWSNIYPTEILLPDGRVVSGENNDVVLILNDVVKHRVPAAYIKAGRLGLVNRHFIRLIIPRYPLEEEIQDWKNQLAENWEEA